MANSENLTVPEKGEVRNPKGRPKGSPNRKTIARQILAMTGLIEEEIYRKLKSRYSTLPQDETLEFIMTLVQVDKAIIKGDTAAYRAVMDSAYGMPNQQLGIDDGQGGPVIIRMKLD
jgi:hypothetical protein